tara:strand:- start:725 stop:1123 length:399 start_codon:yes stop_codon:yes gene_type:complete
MTDELLGLGAGSTMGYVFKFMATMQQQQAATVENLIKKQNAADDSADKAAKRSNDGVWVRRGIVATILFAVVIIPFIMAFQEQGLTISKESNFLGLFTFENYKELSGMVLISEVRVALLSIIGFYFGSSQVK